MNALYNIQQPDIDTLQSRLFITVSLGGISFAVLNPGNTFCSLAAYAFPANARPDEVVQYINEIYLSEKLLQQSFKRTCLIHAFAESILVPGEFMHTDSRQDILELVYGNDSERVIRNDFMPKHYIYNVYGIPFGVLSMLQSKFPAAVHSHQYSCLPDIIKASGNQLYFVFENDHITIALSKDHQLQVVQNFALLSIADLIYYLLNICKQYGVDAKELSLHVAGIVKKDTLLYDELNAHFGDIVLEHLPGNFNYDAAIAKIPSHYFSHLFSLAACVSSAV